MQVNRKLLRQNYINDEILQLKGAKNKKNKSGITLLYKAVDIICSQQKMEDTSATNYSGKHYAISKQAAKRCGQTIESIIHSIRSVVIYKQDVTHFSYITSSLRPHQSTPYQHFSRIEIKKRNTSFNEAVRSCARNKILITKRYKYFQC